MADTNGLPDVDLGLIEEDLKNQAEEKSQLEEKPVEKAVEKESKEKKNLAQFKSEAELLKAYKELQGAFTRTSQENKDLKAITEELKTLKEQISLSQQQTFTPEMPANFDEQYIENPHKAIQDAVLFNRVQEVLEDEQESNPQEFPLRYDYAQRVISQYPNLAKSGRGVTKAFKLGDKLRKDALKQSTSMAIASIFGEPLNDEEIAKLKALVKGDKTITDNKNKINLNAYMPDTSSLTRNRPESTTAANDDIKSTAKKGDVDGVLNKMFETIMAE